MEEDEAQVEVHLQSPCRACCFPRPQSAFQETRPRSTTCSRLWAVSFQSALRHLLPNLLLRSHHLVALEHRGIESLGVRVDDLEVTAAGGEGERATRKVRQAEMMSTASTHGQAHRETGRRHDELRSDRCRWCAASANALGKDHSAGKGTAVRERDPA